MLDSEHSWRSWWILLILALVIQLGLLYRTNRELAARASIYQIVIEDYYRSTHANIQETLLE